MCVCVYTGTGGFCLSTTDVHSPSGRHPDVGCGMPTQLVQWCNVMTPTYAVMLPVHPRSPGIGGLAAASRDSPQPLRDMA